MSPTTTMLHDLLVGDRSTTGWLDELAATPHGADPEIGKIKASTVTSMIHDRVFDVIAAHYPTSPIWPTTPSSAGIRCNANGFHNPKAFITVVMLDRGGLGPDLHWKAA